MKSRSMIVGVTGGIGCGKTTVTNFFATKGVSIIDADQVSRMIVAPGTLALTAIANHFGSKILTQEESLDRKQLKDIIFKNDKERQWLEALLHPLISDQIDHEISQVQSSYAILVSPLMIETNQTELIDRLLVVYISEALQVERTMARDGMSEEQTRSIIQSQVSLAQRLAKADDAVDNSSTLEALHLRLETLHQRYLNLA